MVQPTRIRHSRTLIYSNLRTSFFIRVFTKENATSFLRKSSSPFSLQELRPLTPLKATDRFTSLTVIGMTKIMCNNNTICRKNDSICINLRMHVQRLQNLRLQSSLGSLFSSLLFTLVLIESRYKDPFTKGGSSSSSLHLTYSH
jgi:hypothetical protein